jgi:TonB-dependent starch-binding outer membrane protein SusC
MVTPIANAGNISNKGFEMTLNYNGQKGDFKYSVTGTLSHNKNKIISLAEGSKSWVGGKDITYPKVGYDLFSFWLVKTDGLFRSQAEIDNYVDKDGNKIQPNAKVGDQKFVDADGNGQISGAGNVLDKTGDRQYCGSPFPNFEYGARLDASWKFVDIGLYFQGVSGNKIYNGWRLRTSSYGNDINNFSKEWLDSYSFNPNSDVPRLDLYDANNNRAGFSSRWLEDGSYLRLKTVQIGFTLPESVAKKLSVSKFRFYLAADNLVTWTRYKGYNPDIGNRVSGSGSTKSDKENTGIDDMIYPLARTYHAGLQVNF